VQVPDPESGGPVALFDPRNDRWSDHFCWVEHDIEPLTATGRATIAALDLNHSRRVRIRRAEQMFGLFPPESE